MDGQVRIDCSQIPAVEGRNLGRAFNKAIKEFYNNPDNVEGFEAWKAQRQEVKV